MVKNDLYVTVPSFFKCPISLDVMKSPVSLCTGVTYDRSSIQQWLDSGNNTCPATMQPLPSKDFVPNHNLHRLIQIWVDSLTPSSSSALSHDQARHLIKNIHHHHQVDDDQETTGNCSGSLSKIIDFARESDDNRKFLAETDGIVPIILGVLGNEADTETLGQAVQVLGLILVDYRDKEQLMRYILKGDRDFMSSILLVLQKESLDSRVACARVLEAIAVDPESKLLIAEKDGVLPEMMRLLSPITEEDSTAAAIDAGLSCLIVISTPRRIRLQIVRLGAVQVLGKLLQRPNCGASIIEKVLKLLEMVSTCTEGRTAICDDTSCVVAIVQKMLKVSKEATEHAIVILWSVCHLFRDQNAQEAVTKANGLTKILLLMQSNCSPSVRQMSGDLLKIFRVNSKSCLSGYDTKTTHIMPF
ncbi:U-box domain-containing protein 27-like [Telopea speciosissima]|uniref:U-box domain-containing protein 27-like n=1 Tax=Telopea speciosissima TaxID=54955 RepID=UPI001CC41DB8|nr:U-box domain-containing protein 27-like [Telopea speciosissima]